MSLNQVTNIQDGDETFELWSTEDGSTWEIRKPTPSPGDPAYSAYGILALSLIHISEPTRPY